MTGQIIQLGEYKAAFKNTRSQILCTNCESRSFRMVCENEYDKEYVIECFNCGCELEGLKAFDPTEGD